MDTATFRNLNLLCELKTAAESQHRVAEWDRASVGLCASLALSLLSNGCRLTVSPSLALSLTQTWWGVSSGQVHSQKLWFCWYFLNAAKKLMAIIKFNHKLWVIHSWCILAFHILRGIWQVPSQAVQLATTVGSMNYAFVVWMHFFSSTYRSTFSCHIAFGNWKCADKCFTSEYWHMLCSQDNWIAHQDDFNELLAQLNNCHGQNNNAGIDKQQHSYNALFSVYLWFLCGIHVCWITSQSIFSALFLYNLFISAAYKYS